MFLLVILLPRTLLSILTDPRTSRVEMQPNLRPVKVQTEDLAVDTKPVLSAHGPWILVLQYS